MANTNETYTDPLGQTRKVTFKSVGVDRHHKGSIIIPEKLSEEEAIYWLTVRVKEQNQLVAVNERIPGYPIDVAHALGLASMEMFGFRELKSIPSFFGSTPPTFLTVPTDHLGGTVSVFLGRFSIPGTEGAIQTGRDWNDALIINGKLRQRDIPKLRELIALTKEILQKQSLYKGKAFRVRMEEQREGFDSKVTMSDPEFLDVTKLPADLILDQTTTGLINAALWTPILQAEKSRRYGVKLRRGILLYGPFGTGKTLTAFQTAKFCQENGFTFIYVSDVKDLKDMYRFAARYSPAVLFAEDIDRVVVDHGDEGINMLNNVLDGVDTKNSEVISVLTTNYVDLLPQSLIRPGRFHTMIEYHKPDARVASLLVEQFAGQDLDMDNYDREEVGMALAGQIPASIKEVVDRAKLYSIARTDADYNGDLKLSTPDLLLSAHSMKAHMALLNRESKKAPSMIDAFADRLATTAISAVFAAQTIKGEEWEHSSWNLNERKREHKERAIMAPDPELGNHNR